MSLNGENILDGQIVFPGITLEEGVGLDVVVLLLVVVVVVLRVEVVVLRVVVVVL